MTEEVTTKDEIKGGGGSPGGGGIGKTVLEGKISTEGVGSIMLEANVDDMISLGNSKGVVVGAMSSDIKVFTVVEPSKSIEEDMVSSGLENGTIVEKDGVVSKSSVLVKTSCTLEGFIKLENSLAVEENMKVNEGSSEKLSAIELTTLVKLIEYKVLNSLALEKLSSISEGATVIKVWSKENVEGNDSEKSKYDDI